ncbi:hypothetical protein EN35_36585 [Rhodococcus qingshengii]|nr:hypothetical protein EN35_36585 [Rhodococcus qingshengii]
MEPGIGLTMYISPPGPGSSRTSAPPNNTPLGDADSALESRARRVSVRRVCFGEGLRRGMVRV